MPSITKTVKMGVPAAALYGVITNFEGYPKFLPEVVSAKTLESTPERCKVQFELNLMKRFKYTLEFHMKDAKEVSWKLIESDLFKENKGRWLLTSNDKNTDVQYELEVGFGFFVPSFVAKTLTEVNLPTMFKSFEEQAKKLAH